MTLINIISKIPADVWKREQPPESHTSFVHTASPVDADFHVVYGVRDALRVPNEWRKIFFVASEPPEIRRYNVEVLRRFGAVLGPSFPDVRELPGFRLMTGIAPWWVGINSSTARHYETQSEPIGLDRVALRNHNDPDLSGLSVIISTKARTPLQSQRLRLVDYLGTKLPQFEVFGVGLRPVADKAQVLSRYRYHLAIENSIHPGYWTEKLADPILMGNFVFYGGHAAFRNDLAGLGVSLVDPFDLDGTYRIISDAMESDGWARSAEGRRQNRDAILDRVSFHRKLESVVDEIVPDRPGRGTVLIPPHNPVGRWKSAVDPLYRILRRF